MEKPPVLNEEQVIKWIKDNYGENAIIAPLAHGKTAQRDKDVEWYEKKYLIPDYEYNLQQARQDTAREIFEESENNCIHNPMYIKRRCDTCWQSLESKFLIPPNPVGSADV